MDLKSLGGTQEEGSTLGVHESQGTQGKVHSTTKSLPTNSCLFRFFRFPYEYTSTVLKEFLPIHRVNPSRDPEKPNLKNAPRRMDQKHLLKLFRKILDKMRQLENVSEQLAAGPLPPFFHLNCPAGTFCPNGAKGPLDQPACF